MPTETKVSLSDAQLDTVLAALRFYQHRRSELTDGVEDIASGDGAHEPLSNDAIDDLCETLHCAILPPASIRTEDDRHRVCCPQCGPVEGNRLYYLEDIVCYRRVRGLSEDGRTLDIDGFYESGEGFDDGTHPRLFCRECMTEFAIPEGVELEFL